MLSRIQGTVLGVEDGVAEVRAGELTYAVKVGVEAAEELAACAMQGGGTELLLHMSTGEAGTTLYGFLLPEERRSFRRLLKVSRVGPGLALKILEGITPAELEAAIAAGDAKKLEGVKGVGEKLSRMICVQLGEDSPQSTRRKTK